MFHAVLFISNNIAKDGIKINTVYNFVYRDISIILKIEGNSLMMN